MKNDEYEHKKRFSLKQALGGLFGKDKARSLNRSEKRRPRAGEAGNVFFTLFGAVAVVGVLGAGIMSTMRGPLTTMVEVNRMEEAKAQMRLNTRLIILDVKNGPFGTCGADDQLSNPAASEFTEARAPSSGSPSPTNGGQIPSAIGGNKTDPWGTPYGYCVWDNGADNTGCQAGMLSGENDINAVAIALISAGPDRQFDTTCDQAKTDNEQGDDMVEPLSYNEAITGSSGLWSAPDADTAEIDRDLNVTSSNASNFAGGAQFGNDVAISGGAAIRTDVITPFGAGTTISLMANTIDIDGNGTVSGTLGVTGATTLSTLNATDAVDFDSTLNVDGNSTMGGTLTVTGDTDIGNLDVAGNITGGGDSIVDITDPVDITGTLDVSGDADVGGTLDVTGNFAVNTNMFTVDATTGNTVVAGTTELNGDTVIRGDGNDATTNAFEIWNSDTTPLELFAVDNAGNVSFTGGADLNEQVTITGSTADGTTKPLVINDSTTAEILSVDTEGDLAIAGDLTINGDNLALGTVTENDAGRILIGQNTGTASDGDEYFSSQVMSGDATLSSSGVLTIEDNAVQEDDIDAGSFTTGSGSTCLKTDGSSIFTEDCGSGGGGDGVGAASTLSQLLDNTPNGNDGGGYAIVNIADPTNPQDVATKNYIDTALSSVASDRIQDDDNNTFIDTDTTDNGLTDSIVFNNNGTQSMVIDSAGRVGIGRSGTTTAKLDLYNNDNSITSLLLDTNQANQTMIHINRSGYNGGMRFSSGSSGEMRFLYGASGVMRFDTNNEDINFDNQVSIGTNTPNASASFQIDSTTRGMLTPRMDISQRNAIATPADGLLIFVTDAGDSGIFQFYDADNAQWVDVGGGGAATGGLWEPNGTNDFIEYDDTLGGVRIGRVSGQPAPATDWLLDVTNSVVYTPSNKVGINSSTISTGLELDVTGNIGATNYCDQDGGDCFNAADIATLVGGGGADSDRIEDSDANTFIDVDTTDDGATNSIVFQNNTTQSMIIDASGNVGIGKSDPNDRLTILGGKISIRETDDENDAAYLGSGASTGYLSLLNAGTENVYISSANGSDSYFNAGSVGFGTTTPQTRLDVAGTIRIGDGSELCNAAGHEGAIRYVAASDQYEVCANFSTGWEPLFTSGTGAAGLWTDIGGNRIHYGSTGTERVGIGTNNPITALDVNGGIRVGSVSGDAPNYLSLDGLTDVDASAPANGEILIYNNVSGNWESASAGSITGASTLNDLSDVSTSSPTNDQCLIYNNVSGNWEAGDCDPGGSTSEWTDDGSGNIYNTDGDSVIIGGTSADSITAACTPSIYNAQSNQLVTAPGDTVTINAYAVPSVTSGILFVAVGVENDDGTNPISVSNVTFDGSPLTVIGQAQEADKTAAFYYLQTPSGTGNIVVTTNEPGELIHVTAYTASCLEQQAPEATNTQAAGPSSTGLSTAITTITSNAFIVDSFFNGNDVLPNTVGSGQIAIDINNTDNGSITGSHGASYKLVGTNNTYNMQWASSSNSEAHVVAAFETVPAGSMGTLKLDVAGYIGAESYCNADGSVCNDANSLLSGESYSLSDNDDDTKIQVEENSDEDIIRFDTAGTERMVIDASGNIGIGTQNPQSALHISNGNFELHGDNQDPGFYSYSTTPSAGIDIGIFRSRGSEASPYSALENGDDIGTIEFFGSTNSNWHRAAGIIVQASNGSWTSGANRDSDMLFHVSSGFGDFSERMRINSNGGVSIGGAASADSSAILDIVSTDRGFLPPRLADPSTIVNPATGLLAYNSTNNTYQYNAGDAVTPNWVSFASSAGSANETADADGDTWIRTETNANADNDTIRFAAGANNEHMRITNTGYVGIGTTTPANELHVAGDTRSNTLILNGTSGNAPTYVSPTLALDSLSDVSVGSPSTNDVLQWNGTSWVSGAASGGGGAINDLSDGYTDYATDYNLFMGDSAGASIASGGQYNIAIGQTAADALTTGDSNIALGHNALGAAQDNQGSVAIGRNAAASSNNTHRLVAIGNNAAQNFNGDGWHSIVAIGADAATNITAGANLTAIGNEALNNFPGRGNTAVGDLALFTSNGGGGDNNIAMGTFSGGYMAGNRNVILGVEAFKGGFGGDYDHRGNDNIFIGYQSAINATGNTNNQNIFIGSTTGASLRDGANNILIGYNLDVSSGTAANELNIGNAIFGDLSTGNIGIANTSPDVALDVTGDIEYTGTLTDVSDRRLKTDITPLKADDMINRIANVDTYTFRMKDDEKGQIEYGVMAQEIEKIFPELVRTADDEMGTKSVNYVGLIAPMIEATKSLKAENEALKSEISDIKTAQAEILEEVKGLSRHTGYGMEKANVQLLALMLLMMLLGGAGSWAFQKRRTDKS